MATTTAPERAPPPIGKSMEEAPSAAPTGTPAAHPEAAATPAPSKTAGWARQIRTKQSLLDLVSVPLRIVTAVFTLIAFAVISSDTLDYTVYYRQGFSNGEIIRRSLSFSDFFYLSYLLTVNVLTFVYAIATVVLSIVMLTRFAVSKGVFIGIFALDLILSYLLMSASTSAATGIRIDGDSINSGAFVATANASIAFSFLAFFVLTGVSLLSGLRAIHH